MKAEVERVATRHRLRVLVVSNGGIRPSANPLVETVIVPEGPDEADKWIAERAGPGDVVITGDIPLAAKCVAAGAQVLKHNGEALTAENIGNVLAIRDLMAAATGTSPNLADIVRMVHPKPADAARRAFYGWLIGKPYDLAALPAEIAAFEAWKRCSAGRPCDYTHLSYAALRERDPVLRAWHALGRRYRRFDLAPGAGLGAAGIYQRFADGQNRRLLPRVGARRQAERRRLADSGQDKVDNAIRARKKARTEG